MHLDAEACLDRVETLRSGQLGAGGFEIDDEGNHLGGDLVAALGTAPARQQTGKASRLQRALGLVEGRPGDAEVAAASLIAMPSTWWRRTIS